MEWLLFTSQLPVSPSSLRVMVWRRMKAAGAIGLQNGVWLLAYTRENEQFLLELSVYVQKQGGRSHSFITKPLSKSVEDELLQRAQAQRGEEYAELIEQCQVMRMELEKESLHKKFTFAELEENESEIKKLEIWLHRIILRDPMDSEQRNEAMQQINACNLALEEFTKQVYERDGLGSDLNTGTQGEI